MLEAVMALCGSLILYSAVLIHFGSSPKYRIKERLDSLAGGMELEYVHETVLKEKKNMRKTAGKKLVLSRKFEENLAMSGVKMSAKEYLTIWGVLTIFPGVVGAIAGINLIAVLGVSIVGFAIPPFMVQRSRNKRQLLFNKQLGESLTIMGNCMRSGYSFQQAMASIAQEMQPPISTEFARVVKEMNYGTSMEQALNNMVSRVKNKDLELLISAVITSTQVGANLSEILDTIAETVSDRIKIREDVRVLSAQGRMSGLIIGLLPVVIILFLMIINPNYISDFAGDPRGRLMLTGCVVMEITGFIVINKIVDIKY